MGIKAPYPPSPYPPKGPYDLGLIAKIMKQIGKEALARCGAQREALE